MSYTSVSEMLAERFHMDEKYLKALNPEANFGRPGTIIRVANIGQDVKTPVARIVADKRQKQVRAYDADNSWWPLIRPRSAPPTHRRRAAPIRWRAWCSIPTIPTIRTSTSSKATTTTSSRSRRDRTARWGNVWIALSKPTYGIHGTPDPSKIGKTESHGCVRLTNWDAQELARVVKPGVVVEFAD